MRTHLNTFLRTFINKLPIVRDMNKFTDFIEKYSLNRVTRIKKTLQPHIEYAEKYFTAKARETVQNHVIKLNIIRGRLHSLTAVKAIVLLFLYASVIGTFFQNTILEDAFGAAHLVSGLIGSTLLFIIFTGLSRLSNIYVSDAHTVASLLSSFIESERRVKEVKNMKKKK